MEQLLRFMLPELGLTALLFLLLFFRIGGKPERSGQDGTILHIMLPLLGLAMLTMGPAEGSIFGGMMQSNPMVHYEKLILLAATWLIGLQATPWLSGHRHTAEYHMLVLCVLLGMFFMLSSGDFLIFFLALELASIPLAALCNFDLEKRVSGEAAMKMIFSSAFSSAILLLGISLLYGATGTLSFSQIPAALDGSSLQVTAFLLILTGFIFKLSVVPFHFWTADVYEGSPVPVTAFLSVVSKGAMAFVFVSVLYTVFAPLQSVWYSSLTFLAAVTMTAGNIFAIRQKNIKRLMAFSSIAQVGYLLIGISGCSDAGMASVVYFVLIYVCSNLAAFGVINMVVSATSRERISDLRGLHASNPLLAWTFALACFSLAGIPPTAGFFGKFFLLTAGAGNWNFPVLIIAALNMVVSLYYYLRIVRAMFMDPADEPFNRLSPPFTLQLSLVICISGVLLLGFYAPAYEWIRSISFGF